VLDLEHGALAGLIGTCRGLRDDAVQSGALEPLQPVDGQVVIARHRREMQGTAHLREHLLELLATLFLWCTHQVLAAGREEIECDERRRRLLCQHGDARGRGMQAHLQASEIQAVRGGHDDLAVYHGTDRQLRQKHCVQLGEVAIEWPQIAALNVDVVFAGAAKHDGAKAVPFRLIQEVAIDRNEISQLGEHGFDGRADS